MKVGVFVPCHNDGDKLPRCLDALLNQTRPLDKIVIVLDRCTDNSLKVAKKYAEKYPQIEYHVFKPKTNHPCAVSEVINYGMSKLYDCDVGGEVDTDEVVAPNWVEKLAPMLNDEIAVVSGLHYEHLSGSIADHFNLYTEWYRKRASKHGSAIPNQSEPTGGARLYWMKTWRKVGGYKKLWSADNEFDHRIVKLGYKYAVSTETRDDEYRRFSNAVQWFKRKYRYGYGEYGLGFPLPYLLQRTVRNVVMSLLRLKNLKVTVSILASDLCLIAGWIAGFIFSDQFVTKDVCRERIYNLVVKSFKDRKGRWLRLII